MFVSMHVFKTPLPRALQVDLQTCQLLPPHGGLRWSSRFVWQPAAVPNNCQEDVLSTDVLIKVVLMDVLIKDVFLKHV